MESLQALISPSVGSEIRNMRTHKSGSPPCYSSLVLLASSFSSRILKPSFRRLCLHSPGLAIGTPPSHFDSPYCSACHVFLGPRRSTTRFCRPTPTIPESRFNGHMESIGVWPEQPMRHDMTAPHLVQGKGVKLEKSEAYTNPHLAHGASTQSSSLAHNMPDSQAF